MITVNNREQFLIELSKFIPKESVGVELGVLHGDFSRLILDILNPKHLILIDPYENNDIFYSPAFGTLSTAYSTDIDYEIVLQKFKKEIEDGKVMVRKKYSYEAVQRYPDNSINFIYNDASHRYTDLRRDLNDWLPKLKDNGIMAGHDMIDLYGFGLVCFD